MSDAFQGSFAPLFIALNPSMDLQLLLESNQLKFPPVN